MVPDGRPDTRDWRRAARHLRRAVRTRRRPTRVRAGEPLRRATLSQSLYLELSIRSFSKLDQTDHIGRWDGAESECVGPKLGVQESDEKNEENHNLRFNGIFRLLCVNISPGWIGSRRPLPVSRRWVRWRRFVRARWLLRLPDRDQRLAYALRGRWFRRQRHYRRAANGGGSFAFGGAGIGALSCTWRCPDGAMAPAPNPPGLWREYMVVMNSTNFCKDHMNRTVSPANRLYRLRESRQMSDQRKHRKTGTIGSAQSGATSTRVASNTGDTGSVNTRDTES